MLAAAFICLLLLHLCYCVDLVGEEEHGSYCWAVQSQKRTEHGDQVTSILILEILKMLCVALLGTATSSYLQMGKGTYFNIEKVQRRHLPCNRRDSTELHVHVHLAICANSVHASKVPHLKKYKLHVHTDENYVVHVILEHTHTHTDTLPLLTLTCPA